MDTESYLNKIKEAVEISTGVKDLFLKKRTQKISDARCLFYKYVNDNVNISVTKLGKYTGQHHATVIHSIKKFNDLYAYDKSFKNTWGEMVSNEILSKSLLSKFNRYQELDRILELFPNNEVAIHNFFEDIENLALTKYSRSNSVSN